MRALQPDASGVVDSDGVQIAYDVYNETLPVSVVLLPTWAIAEPLHWKAQIAVLARQFRVITVDGRGTSRSGRPTEPSAHTREMNADDILAVMDATATVHAVIAGVSLGGGLACFIAARNPERVTGTVLIAPAL